MNDLRVSRPLLVTGGAGFIGSNFIRYVLARGFQVINLDKLTYAGNLNNLSSVAKEHTFVLGDILDDALLRTLFEKYQPQAVVHFAAESHVDRSIDGPEQFIQTNIVGTFKLLEAFRKFNSTAGGGKFLHISTDEVFGSLEPHEEAFTEKSNYVPNSPYAASKAAADHLVRAYHHTYGLHTITTHCSNNYGPYQFPEKLIPLTILNALQKRPLPIYGDGQQVRDWLYVEDHCEALLLALKLGHAGSAYNIGGSAEQTNLQTVKDICAACATCGGANLESLISFVTDRPGHDRRYAIDSSLTQKELGWKPTHSFKEGLAKTVKWYIDNPEWCSQIASDAYRERLGLTTYDRAKS
jgi:dTDP-glucose 4,6-dehydratase